MKNSLYRVSYLLRKTSMTLTEIRALGLGQFQDICQEVMFQESVDDYKTASYIANLMAAIANTVPRKHKKTYKSKDFLTAPEPRRSGGDPVTDAKVELEALADKFSIRLPDKEIVDL